MKKRFLIIFLLFSLITILSIVIPLNILNNPNKGLIDEIDAAIWLGSGVIDLGIIVFIILFRLTTKNK